MLPDDYIKSISNFLTFTRKDSREPTTLEWVQSRDRFCSLSHANPNSLRCISMFNERRQLFLCFASSDLFCCKNEQWQTLQSAELVGVSMQVSQQIEQEDLFVVLIKLRLNSCTVPSTLLFYFHWISKNTKLQFLQKWIRGARYSPWVNAIACICNKLPARSAKKKKIQNWIRRQWHRIKVNEAIRCSRIIETGLRT